MAKVETKETLLAQIEACKKTIDKQNAKIAKLQAKVDAMKKQEVVNAILASGKSMDEILAFLNN